LISSWTRATRFREDFDHERLYDRDAAASLDVEHLLT
jgi:hypothetical protein